jgi:thiol-disulfide isomerase/thioredoxin
MILQLIVWRIGNSQMMACTLFLPDSLSEEKIQIEYFNGIETKTIKLETIKKKTIYDSLYSVMGWISVHFETKDEYKQFNENYFIKPGKSEIKIKNSKTGFVVDLKNAITAESAGEKDIAIYSRIAISDLKEFYEKNATLAATNDSIRTLLIHKAELVGIKRYQFILDNPNLYYSFWLFHTDILKANCFHPDTLLHDFHSYFPQEFKYSKQGIAIENILRSQSLQLSTKIAPNINAKDLNGKTFNLYKETNSIIVINFWASWCGPCYKEIAELKKLSKMLANRNISFVTISIDENKAAFEKASKQLSASWINILGGSNLQSLFAIGAVPRILAIEGGQHIIYDSETHSPHQRLETLKAFLLKHSKTK